MPKRRPIKPETKKPFKPNSGDLSLDLTDPVKARRVEIIQQMFGEGYTEVGIKRAIAAGSKELDLKPMSYPNATRYFRLAVALMEGEFEKDMKARVLIHRQRLLAVHRKAMAKEQLGVCGKILDRVALIEGVANPITTPRQIKIDPPKERTPIQKMSDAELTALALSAGIDPKDPDHRDA